MQGTGRQSNVLWGLVLVALAVVFVLRAFGQVPDGLFDAVGRAWPVLLVLVGLTIFLRPRVPLGGFIALVVSAALVGGVAVYAFSTRATEQRVELSQPFTQALPAGVTLLRVRVHTGTAQVDLLPSLQGQAVSGEFLGSRQSGIDIDYVEEADGSATLTLREAAAGQFPMLEAVGRGALRIELPPGVPLDVELLGTDGGATLNMVGLSVERMNVNLQRGNLLVTLPAYDPVYSQAEDTLGTVAALNGDITIVVPEGVAARLDLEREGSGIEPEYNPSLYDYLRPDTLQSVNIRSATISQRYVIAAPRGVIRVREVQ